MTDQPALFPVDQTTDTVCPVCAAVRPAGQPKTNGCGYDRDPDGRRPQACLNTHDPATAPIPY